MKKQKDPAAVKLGRRGGKAPTKKKKGFAAMNPDLQRKYSAKGGKISAKKKRKAEREKKKLQALDQSFQASIAKPARKKGAKG